MICTSVCFGDMLRQIHLRIMKILDSNQQCSSENLQINACASLFVLYCVYILYVVLLYAIDLRDGFIYSISFSDAKRVDNLNKSNLNKNVKIDVDKKGGDDSDEGKSSFGTNINFSLK